MKKIRDFFAVAIVAALVALVVQSCGEWYADVLKKSGGLVMGRELIILNNAGVIAFMAIVCGYLSIITYKK